MKTCDTCKHWDKEMSNYVGGIAAECNNPKNQELQNFDEDEKREYTEDGAYPWDASSYSAGLMTAPKFGCVNHEKG